MEGITDAPMRALQGSTGAFTYAVSEFLRVSSDPLPSKVFLRDIPELLHGGKTPTGVPVQIQLLGGDPDLMAQSAVAACESGAPAIDINFGCPAKTVNRHDGGASLLKHPFRIREIVAAVRSAVPASIPVSAKLRLGWDSIESIHLNAAMAAEGGAAWLTIHARTRVQGYLPPVFWPHVGQVKEDLRIPIIANGDIWTFEDFLRCREETGCIHYMIGRGALANPVLSRQIADELGIRKSDRMSFVWSEEEWIPLLQRLIYFTDFYGNKVPLRNLLRFKQWLKLAKLHGGFEHFDAIKGTSNLVEFFDCLSSALHGECTADRQIA